MKNYQRELEQACNIAKIARDVEVSSPTPENADAASVALRYAMKLHRAICPASTEANRALGNLCLHFRRDLDNRGVKV